MQPCLCVAVTKLTAYSKGKIKTQFHEANVAERSLACRLHLPIFISLFHTFFFHSFCSDPLPSTNIWLWLILTFGIRVFVCVCGGGWTVLFQQQRKKSAKIWVNAIIPNSFLLLFSYFIFYFIQLIHYYPLNACTVCSVAVFAMLNV